MRAIFLIPTKPAPKLTNESMYSKEFIDFIEKCLDKNVETRPSAKTLLDHPFITNNQKKNAMSQKIDQLINQLANGKKLYNKVEFFL